VVADRQHVRLVKFVLDRKLPRGIPAVAVSRKVGKIVRDVAVTKALPYAKSIAPRQTGAYAGSFGVRRTLVHDLTKLWPMTRVAAQVFNNDPAAIVIEKGSARVDGDRVVAVSGDRVLGRTLAHLHASAVMVRPRPAKRRGVR